MPYFVCPKCRERFAGWGAGKTCSNCGEKLKEITGSEMDNLIKKKDREENKK